MKPTNKLYITRKYIWAKSAPEAIKRSIGRAPDDVYVDDEWRKNQRIESVPAIGFKVSHPDEVDEV